MPSVHYLPMHDTHHQPVLMWMMQSLYREDPAAVPPGESHFTATIQRLLTRPATGQIILFLDHANTLHGYAILIPFWSNELGGVVLFVDELYVRPESRGRGLARGLFTWIQGCRPFDARIIALEVSTGNEPARRLYQSLGFEPRRYNMMTLAMK